MSIKAVKASGTVLSLPPPPQVSLIASLIHSWNRFRDAVPPATSKPRPIARVYRRVLNARQAARQVTKLDYGHAMAVSPKVRPNREPTFPSGPMEPTAVGR